MAIQFDLAQADIMVSTNPLTKGELLDLEESMSPEELEEELKEMEEMEERMKEEDIYLTEWGKIFEDHADFDGYW